MAAPRIRNLVLGAVSAVAAIIAIDSTGLLSPTAAVVVDDLAQLTGGLTAAACCWWTARRLTGLARRWRVLMGIGMTGWSAGQLIWSWYQICADTPMPSPSLADVGYLSMPVFALAALLSFLTDGRGADTRGTDTRGALGRGADGAGPRALAPPNPSRLVLVLDGLVVVGSLFTLTWSTALGAVVHNGGSSPLRFAVAVAQPGTDLILVVMVMLLLAAHRVARPYRQQLLLLGLGLVALASSDSIYVYLISVGAAEMPPVTNAGFLLGPALIAVAALDTRRMRVGQHENVGAHTTDLARLGLPYLPLIATGMLIIAQTVAGQRLDPVEIYVGLAVISLVVARQMIALVENTSLLERVSEGQQRLAYQAYHDPLTGLGNRALFRERLNAAVEVSRESQRPLALLYIDLDDFKAINDNLGHGAGDAVLRTVGERLRACVRHSDTIARLGGDEFGIILDGDAELPHDVGDRILTTLRRPFGVAGRTATIGASVGVVVVNSADPELTPESLLRRADAAMYAGKRNGKGALVVYEPGLSETGDPDLPTMLAAALRHEPGVGGIDVHYQPIVSLVDGGTVALEALARWHTPGQGSISPDVFVAAAERAGIIAELDNLVLDHACRALNALGRARPEQVSIHVNISASRLCDPELERSVRDALHQHGLAAGQLVLEITETSRIPDLDVAAATSRRLRGLGVRLALDDFGTGYNSLTYLHLLPVDIVKIAGIHTVLAQDSQRMEQLCRSVLVISQAMGMAVIAEGVETEEQVEILARLGCALGQGYLFGRPEPLPQLPPTEQPTATGAFQIAIPQQATGSEFVTPAG